MTRFQLTWRDIQRAKHRTRRAQLAKLFAQRAVLVLVALALFAWAGYGDAQVLSNAQTF